MLRAWLRSKRLPEVLLLLVLGRQLVWERLRLPSPRQQVELEEPAAEEALVEE